MKSFPEQSTHHEEKMKATIFDIQRNSFVDGPGIRTTVFFKGCNLNCKWCHNPESQSFEKQMMFYQNKCTSCGKCKLVCPYNLETCDLCGQCTDVCPSNARQICGKEYTVAEVLKIICNDKTFYENSGGGVTFSGGECMLHIDFLKALLKKCKGNGIHTAVDTAGSVPWQYFEKIMPDTDLFLYDVKCFSEQLHIDGTGVSNKLILENLKRLSDHFKGSIIIRIPVIHGFNDNSEEVMKISGFLKNIRYDAIEILPYHKMGEHKYAALGMKCNTYYVPKKENIAKYKQLLNL